MPSHFEALRNIALQDVADEFAEQTQLITVKSNGYLAANVDETLMPYTLPGVVSLEGGTAGRVGRQLNPGVRIAAESGEVRYHKHLLGYGTSYGRMPQTGDKVKLIDREEQPLYRIANGYDDGRGRWVCEIERIQKDSRSAPHPA